VIDAHHQEPGSQPGIVARHAALIKGVSVAIIVVSLVLVARQLPVAAAVGALEAWVDGLGAWGPVVFGAVYVVLVVLLVPASALTLAAGAIFGLTTGVVVVSLASNTGAALAFLIARYLARNRVAAYIRRHPRLAAVDRAVGEGGWKIVALLRLSPAVPFTLQNYLYGLTRIRFLTCVVTSWVTMLPGTFLYIYLGHLGRAGVEATTGAAGRGPAEWALLAVGLLATVAVTVYVTRLARRALRQHEGIEQPPTPQPADVPDRPWGALAATALAALALAGAILIQVHPEPVRQWVTDLLPGKHQGADH
jgi:uncharacterized membrane protein YdjX (TVP38/TMEM64 family)